MDEMKWEDVASAEKHTDGSVTFTLNDGRVVRAGGDVLKRIITEWKARMDQLPRIDDPEVPSQVSAEERGK